jgi:hypothetical protein
LLTDVCPASLVSLLFLRCAFPAMLVVYRAKYCYRLNGDGVSSSSNLNR